MASRILWGFESEVSLFITDGDLQPLDASYTIWAQVYTGRPQRAEILANSGGILASDITSFTLDPITGAIKVTLPPIPDPDINSDESETAYYLGIAYRSSALAPLQATIAALKMVRGYTFLSRLNITQADIQGVDRNIKWLYGDNSTAIANISDQVEQEFINFFKSRKIDIHAIQNMGDLKFAGIYKALELAHLSEVQTKGDGHDLKSRRYAEKAADALSQYASDIRAVDNEQGEEMNMDNTFGSVRVIG